MPSRSSPRLAVTKPPGRLGDLGEWYRLDTGEDSDGPPVFLRLMWPGEDGVDSPRVDVVMVGNPDVRGGPAITADDLRDLPLGAVYRIMNAGRLVWSPGVVEDRRAVVADHALVVNDDVEPLARVKGETSEEFAERVAEQYRRALRRTRYPATEIANASDVSVRTVHTWIRQARKLGKLPPGRKGAAG